MQTITSKDNPIIKLYKKLSADKKARLEHGMFTAEGVRLADEAAAAGLIDSILITKSRLEVHKRDFSENVKVCVISDELGKKLSDTENPQGLFAICNMPAKPDFDSINPAGLYILLHHIRDPGNMGAVIRSAHAFDFHVFAVDCCDIYSPKVVRSSMGGVFRVPVYDTTIEEAFAVFKENGIETCAAVADKNAAPIEDINLKSGVVFIGNEANGLPDGVIQRCDRRFTVKMRGGAESLNAAVAAGIIMYQLTVNSEQ